MKKINKTTVLLAFIVLAAVVGLVSAFQQNMALKKALVQKSQSCEQQVARLEADFQTQIAELQDYLLAQYDSKKTDKSMQNEEEDPIAAARPKLANYDETLEELVMRKYRFLFSNLNLSEADKIKLQQLLMERERLNLLIQDAKEYEEVAREVSIQQLELQLADIEAQIQALLNQENYERFDLLKDSEEEQHDFTQYTLGINSLFPLTHEQQEAVLFSKLRHKQVFEEALKKFGLDNDYPLTTKQRDQLYANVESALEEYKHRFLQDVHQQLDHSNFPFDQYTLLENYETTEFKAEKERLEALINKRYHGD